MDIMLQRILELVGEKHGAGKELCDALQIKPNMVTEWRKERVKSYTKYAPQIAEYYGVSLDWLSGLSDEKTQKEKPLTEDEELNRYLDELRNRSEMRMLFSVSEGCTKEEVEQAVKIIEALRKQ